MRRFRPTPVTKTTKASLVNCSVPARKQRDSRTNATAQFSPLMSSHMISLPRVSWCQKAPQSCRVLIKWTVVRWLCPMKWEKMQRSRVTCTQACTRTPDTIKLTSHRRLSTLPLGSLTLQWTHQIKSQSKDGLQSLPSINKRGRTLRSWSSATSRTRWTSDRCQSCQREIRVSQSNQNRSWLSAMTTV